MTKYVISVLNNVNKVFPGSTQTHTHTHTCTQHFSSFSSTVTFMPSFMN